MGSNTWACHGVWWWIIRTWHVITWLHITVYCILPTYLYCSSYSIIWGPLFLPPAPLWPIMALAPRWEDCRTAAAAGSPKGLQAQRPAICPCACGVSEPPKLAQPPANIKLKPSWNRLITDRYFACFIHVHPLLDVHPFHGSNVCIIRISWIKGYYRYGDFMGWNLKSLGQVTKTQPLWMIRRLSAAPGNGLRAHWRDLTAEPAHWPPRRAKTTPPVVRCGESTSVQRLFKSWPWKSSQVQSPWSNYRIMVNIKTIKIVDAIMLHLQLKDS